MESFTPGSVLLAATISGFIAYGVTKSMDYVCDHFLGYSQEREQEETKFRQEFQQMLKDNRKLQKAVEILQNKINTSVDGSQKLTDYLTHQ